MSSVWLHALRWIWEWIVSFFTVPVVITINHFGQIVRGSTLFGKHVITSDSVFQNDGLMNIHDLLLEPILLSSSVFHRNHKAFNCDSAILTSPPWLPYMYIRSRQMTKYMPGFLHLRCLDRVSFAWYLPISGRKLELVEPISSPKSAELLHGAHARNYGLVDIHRC